jgi:anti-sigma B factor antagonist
MLMTSAESILYARLPDDLIVVRIAGKGNHQNSLALREVMNLTTGAEGSPTYIFDLEKCTTMDSTFMGVLASLALRQQRSLGTRPIVVNINDHVRDLLNNLGLKYILEMRRGRAPETDGDPLKVADYSSVEAPMVDKINRIILMIEAHEKLIDLQSENEVQFKGVLQSLRESLDRTRGMQP